MLMGIRKYGHSRRWAQRAEGGSNEPFAAVWLNVCTRSRASPEYFPADTMITTSSSWKSARRLSRHGSPWLGLHRSLKATIREGDPRF